MMPCWKLGLIWICLLAASSCQMNGGSSDAPPPPENMVDRATFIHLHADLQLLEAAYRQRMLPGGDRDAVRAAQRALTLANAGVSDSAFTAPYNWWYSQPEALPDILREVQVTLDSLQRASKWNGQP